MPDSDALKPRTSRAGLSPEYRTTSVALMVVTQLPGQDVAREVIEHGRQIEPAPTDHPQVGKVGLPELIGCGGWMGEAVGRLSSG